MNLWGIILCEKEKNKTVGYIFYVSVWNDKTVGMEDKLVFASHCGMRSEENGGSYRRATRGSLWHHTVQYVYCGCSYTNI